MHDDERYKKAGKQDRYFRDERRLPLRCKDPLGSAGADQPSTEHHLILRGGLHEHVEFIFGMDDP